MARLEAMVHHNGLTFNVSGRYSPHRDAHKDEYGIATEADTNAEFEIEKVTLESYGVIKDVTEIIDKLFFQEAALNAIHLRNDINSTN